MESTPTFHTYKFKFIKVKFKIKLKTTQKEKLKLKRASSLGRNQDSSYDIGTRTVSVLASGWLAMALAFAAPSLSLANDKLVLALNWKAEPQFGGFFAALNDNHFKKAGLPSVSLQEGGSGTPTLQMLTSGTAEYAVVSADEIVLAHARGNRDVVALFASYQTNPQAIMLRRDHSAKTLQELFADSSVTLLWQQGLPYAQYLIRKLGTPKAKLAPYSGGIGPFLQNSQIAQQVFATSEPLLAEKAGVATREFLISDEGYNPYTTVLATRATRLRANPKEAEAMISAVREGWLSYLKDPEPTNKRLVQQNPSLDLPTANLSAERQRKLIDRPVSSAQGAPKGFVLGSMTADRWATLARQMTELKLIPSAPEAKELFWQPGLALPNAKR